MQGVLFEGVILNVPLMFRVSVAVIPRKGAALRETLN